MKDPIHPGLIVKHDCLEARGVNVTEAASALGVSRTTLSRVVNCKAAVSAEMAIRLENTFGSTADTWLRMQAAYDLALARRQVQNDIETRPLT